MGNLLNVGRGVLEHKINWNNEYLTFEALESGTFLFTKAINYSLDGGATWTELEAETDTPTLAAGDKISWKATLTPNSTDGIGTFSSSGSYNAMGNPLSLKLGDSFVGVTTMPNNFMFSKLFFENTRLVNTENLAIGFYTGQLKNYCFSQMFEGCTSLIKTPKLPSAEISSYSCNAMFKGCTSLVVAPDIPFTTRANSSARNELHEMFRGCTSLTNSPASLSLTSTGIYTYGYMFYGCINLESVPSISTTQFGAYCCRYMFQDCVKIIAAPSIIVTSISSNCFEYMFYGCSALKTTFPLPLTTLQSNCYVGMYSNCSSLIIAPELPAPTLVSGCYNQMFRYCTSLNYIKCLATDISTGTTNWLQYASSTGTFVKDANTTWPSGVSGIPAGWTVQDYVEN